MPCQRNSIIKYVNLPKLYSEKRNLSIHRVRLTIGDSRGPALNDKRKLLKDYCNNALFIIFEGPDTDSMTLVFKDLGPQISWQNVNVSISIYRFS